MKTKIKYAGKLSQKSLDNIRHQLKKRRKINEDLERST